MAQVRVREVVGTVRVVDGDALLSPALLERIVRAVLQALEAQRRQDLARRRDTRIEDGSCESGERRP